MPSSELKDLKTALDRITQQLYLGRTYLLLDRAARKYLHENRDVAKMAPVYLTLTLLGLRDEAIIHVCRLYDRDTRVLNLKRLRTLAESKAGLARDTDALKNVLTAWDDQVEEIGALVDKLGKYRNNYFAHLNWETVIRGSGSGLILRMSEVEELYDHAITFVNELSSLFLRSRTHMELLGLDDFRWLLDNAARGNALFKSRRWADLGDKDRFCREALRLVDGH